MTPTRGLLDTSVFIATESGRGLDEARLPDEAATSVVTLAELQVGVLAATDVGVRAQRLATLDALAEMGGLPIVTQDDDFDPVDGVAGLSVIKV